MSRFSAPQDPIFQSLNSSLSFDRRLWHHDIAQSRAHARMLAGRSIISDEDRDALLATRAIDALAEALLDAAERHLDWALPGYTHLQRAQPVYLSHHLLAYVWMLLRDRDRFTAVIAAAASLPLGAGALAGVNFDVDRRQVAAALGFEKVAENSIDAVSNRDFVLDYLGAAATCATHLSRLGGELVLWSSQEFGFCDLPDAWTSGSSI